MKRTYISPEFDYKPVYGSFTMEETSVFFGSKMLKIENYIDILNENLIYNQLNTGEQIDESSELNLPQIIYDTTLNKKFNHTILLDLDQTEFQKENSAKWEARIELRDILTNHLFAILKNARTFEGLKIDMVLNGDVDSSIYDYITKNIISRYSYTKMDLFLEYIDLCNDDTLQYAVKYDYNIEKPQNKTEKFLQEVSSDGNFLNISFNQEKPAYAFSFRYYFNLYFEKL
jgi:hypothetical protein